jgi:hypothetical protein
MKQFKVFFTAILLLCIATNSCSQKNNKEDSSVMGIFIASTPCSKHTKPVPGIPQNADCELIKWNLTLYQHTSDKTPATYKLHCVYGVPEQGTTGFIGGGKELEIEGKWTIVKGTAANPGAVVYQLHDDRTMNTISFVKLSDDLLHLLDADKRLMIGSAAWSYTLNRKQ